MPTIQKISMNLIEQAVKDEWKYRIDNDGDVSLTFKKETEFDELNAYFDIRNEHSLYCFGFYDLVIPDDYVSQALYLCNQYNNSHYGPNAYLQLKEERKHFRLQSYHRLDEGIHAEALKILIGSFVSGCASFEKWMLEQPEFWIQ